MDENDQRVDGADEQAGAGVAAPTPVDPAAAVMRLLAEHVPLALLADLAAPDGPASQVILETEGLPDEAWWESGPGRQPAATPDPEPAVADPETRLG